MVYVLAKLVLAVSCKVLEASLQIFLSKYKRVCIKFTFIILVLDNC